MMRQEFEKMVGREVTPEQYDMLERLYMQSTLNKQDFAKSVKKLVQSLQVGGQAVLGRQTK